MLVMSTLDQNAEYCRCGNFCVFKFLRISDFGTFTKFKILDFLFLFSSAIHCLYDFAHKQDFQLNSSVLITVCRVVIEV